MENISLIYLFIYIFSVLIVFCWRFVPFFCCFCFLVEK